MVTYNFEKAVNLDRLTEEIRAANLLGLVSITSSQGITDLVFENWLSGADLDSLNTVVQNHQKVISTDVTANIMKNALSFCQDTIKLFGAENIAMGITQAGKTAEVLAVLTKKYGVPSEANAISLYESLMSGSLYAAIAVLDHLSNNPSEYEGLSPFLTSTRLNLYKAKIQTFLGI